MVVQARLGRDKFAKEREIRDRGQRVHTECFDRVRIESLVEFDARCEVGVEVRMDEIIWEGPLVVFVVEARVAVFPFDVFLDRPKGSVFRSSSVTRELAVPIQSQSEP